MQSSLSPARLFDGVRARPRLGTVHLLDDTLVFGDEDGNTVDWNVEKVHSIHRVADEVHVEIAAGEGTPPLKLVVDDPAFEEQLDEVRTRFAVSPGVGLGARMRRLGVKGWLIITAIVVPTTWAAYTIALPYAHVLISAEAEAELGEKVYQAVIDKWKVIEDAGFRDLCATMVAELKDPDAGFDVRVTVVDEDHPNAFAAPGGRIVIFSGLLRLCPSPDALAGVLAHEIAHVEERHGLKHLLRSLGVVFFAGCFIGGGVEEFATAETIAELSSGLLILKHSRDHEHEADRIAVDKLKRAGREATGLEQFFTALGKEMPSMTGMGWVSTHPLTSDRIAEVSRLSGAEDPKARPWLDPEEWRALCLRIMR